MGGGPRSGFYYALAGILLMLAGVFGAEAFDLTHQQKVFAFVVTTGLAIGLVLIGAIKEIRTEIKKLEAAGHRRRMVAIAGMLVCGLGFLSFTGMYFWPSSPVPKDAALPLDNKISFSCYGTGKPTTLREEKPTHMVEIIEPYMNNLTVSVADTFWGPGTEKINWGDDSGTPDWMLRCTVTNYSDVPLFGVRIPLAIEWLEVEKFENGTRSGNKIAALNAISPPLDLGIGAHNNIDYFYIANFSLYWVSIASPDAASIGAPGEASIKTVKLIPQSMFMPMTLQPNPHRKPAPTSPPTEAPQPPAPPEPPKEK
jgi:hypothetical protein